MDVAVNGLEEAEKRVEESAAALEAEDSAEEGSCRRGAVGKTGRYTADGNGVSGQIKESAEIAAKGGFIPSSSSGLRFLCGFLPII